MGFNYYRYGHIKPCGVEDGYVYYMLPSGTKVKHKTQLSINIKEQTNLFISDTVAFLLYNEDKMYIGRYDGSISIYRVSDELLVGLNNWEPPRYVETKPCGFCKFGEYLDEIHLDLRDNRTLYICGRGSEACLSAPISSDFDLCTSSFCVSVLGSDNDYAIFDERGDPIAAKFWPIQEDVRIQNCRIFL